MTAVLKEGYWRALTTLRDLRTRQWPAWRRYRRILAEVNRDGGARVPRPCARRLLLLTWEFPPSVTGGVYRPASFLQFARAHGWEASAIVARGPAQPTSAGEYLWRKLPPELGITRVEPAPSAALHWLPRLDGGMLNAMNVYTSARAQWMPGPRGVILASGPPFHSFLAARWLSAVTGWKLVLDYRDEWTEAPFAFVDKAAENRAFEDECLRHADRVIFTTESQRTHALSCFPSLRQEATAVVYNGWDPEDFVTAEGSIRSAAGPLRLAYLGNLGAMASPASFLETLASVLARDAALRAVLRVQFIGTRRPDALEHLRAFPYPEVIELVDPVPKADACRIMQEVDGLLLLNPSELTRYIQGKFYEYMAAGTRILVYGAGGEMGGIVDRLNAGDTVPEGNVEALAAVLRGLRVPPAGDAAARRAWLASRERGPLAAHLYAMLDALIAEPPR